MNDFLLTYRYFQSPENFAEMLVYRLNFGFMQKEQTVKLRTFVVLRHWLCHYYEVDFCDGDEIKRLLLNAIKTIQTTNGLELTIADQQILSKLQKYVNREDLAPDESSLIPDSSSIATFH